MNLYSTRVDTTIGKRKGFTSDHKKVRYFTLFPHAFYSKQNWRFASLYYESIIDNAIDQIPYAFFSLKVNAAMMFGGSVDNESNEDSISTASSVDESVEDDNNMGHNKSKESVFETGEEDDDDDDDDDEYTEDDEDMEVTTTDNDDGDESYDESFDDEEDYRVTEDDDDDDSRGGEYFAAGSFNTTKQSSARSEVVGNGVGDGGDSKIFGIFKSLSSSASNSSDIHHQTYDPSYSSHSFASDATEDRGHSPQLNSPQEQRNNNKASLEYSGGASTDGSHVLVKTKSNEGVVSPRVLSNSNSFLSTDSKGKHKQRFPGGGAAKLIGIPSIDDYPVANNEDDGDYLEVVAPIDELIRSRDMAKAEFSVGSMENKRYHAPAISSKENVHNKLTSTKDSRSRLPRILDRNEGFHENAAAAIVSILTPTNKSIVEEEIDEILTSRSGTGDLQLTTSDNLSNNSSLMKSKSGRDASSSPIVHPAKRGGIAIESLRSDAPNAVEDAIETLSTTGKSPLVQQLLTKRTERRLGSIKGRMKDPNKNLTELMEAIASPKSGHFDKHYMVRRKNACGALKVLTANASHRINICWTLGVLPVLTSVLEDSGPDMLEDAFPDEFIRREYHEARKRAVSALVNLAIPKDNKLPIFHCPRLVASVILVINQDDDEARRGCCSILAHLSKSRENRLIMAQVPGLLDAVSLVIEPKEKLVRSNEFVKGDTFECIEMPQDVFDQPEEDEEEDPAETSARYDEDPNEYTHSSRQNMFALLSHLLKEKDNAFILARHSYLIDTLVAITRLQESSSQQYGLKLFAHLSRHCSNSKILVFKMKEVVPAVVFATHSEDADSRQYACYTLQNFSQDKPCRQHLASIDNLLMAVCRRIRGAKIEEEKLSALHILKNLTDEPANLIPMTNTPTCFDTLMHVAHASDDSVTEMMQYLECDALATLSHWFHSIATSGQRIATMNNHENENPTTKNMNYYLFRHFKC